MKAIHIEQWIKESERAHLVRSNGIDLWIPKSILQTDPMDSTKAMVEDWFVNKSAIGAMFSEDRKYRYHLFRTWNERKKKALCIGLNPSTANVGVNDQTIGRLCRFLSALDYGGFRMVNLFTIISSNPTILLTPEAKSDIQKDLGLIFANSMLCQDVIFCWGAFPEAKERASKVIEFYPDAKCFGKTVKGDPWHPLACFYAGLKEKDVRLFEFKTHDPKLNRDNRKRNKKKKIHSYSQIPLIEEK